MQKRDYDNFVALGPEEIVAWHFASNRTLAYGYTCSRQTWHVYKDISTINKVVYNWQGDVLEHWRGLRAPMRSLVPDKRLYPEATDYGFAKAARQRGLVLPFTTWDDERAASRGAGPLFGQTCDCDLEVGRYHGPKDKELD